MTTVKRFNLILLALLLLGLTSKADTITVTSNADSGPGTLREAIAIANNNGTSAVDTILFNIPDISRSGRTIVLNSPLPALSSHLIIDASVQTGTTIGPSTARVILLVNAPQTAAFTIFQISNATDIEICGLFFFNEVFTLFTSYSSVNGIGIYRSSDIRIGKPGKGNYFRGLYYGINSLVSNSDEYYRPNCDNISIQSNVFGNDEAGEPTMSYPGNTWGYVNPLEYAVYLLNTSNIKIGGDNIDERNVITASNLKIESNFTTGNGYLIMHNNYMAIPADGTIPVQTGAPQIFIIIRGNYSDHLTDYDISLKKNIINGRIEIYYHSKYFTIQGNKIFGCSGISSSADYSLRLLTQFCYGGGIIGGDAPDEQNEIFNTTAMMLTFNGSVDPTGAILVNVAPNVLIRKNKTYCSARYGAGVQVLYFSNQPHIQIDSLGTGFVRGKATPNCKIEVFQDDDCLACDGIALLGETVSLPDSNWSFSGNFTGTVIATATHNDSSTSGYTEPTFRLDSIKLKHPSCGLANGSITGLKMLHSWTSVEWHHNFLRNGFPVDSIISHDIDLLDVEAGYYYFIAKLGTSCQSGAFYYQLNDYTPKIVDTNVFITHPSCGLFTGSITGIIVDHGDYSRHTWIDAAGNTYSGSSTGNFAYLGNLPPGRYRLIVTDTIAGCSDTTNWYDLINQAGPSLITGNIQINNSTCGTNNGSITGFTATNVIGVANYTWVDSLNNIVGHNADLVNVTAGKYKLKFKDQGACDTIFTPYYIIPDIGKITIDTSQKIIHPAGCSVNNGSISNIIAVNAITYQWQNLSTSATAGSTIDINNLSAGNYQLSASNSYGCTAVSPVLNIPLSDFTPLSPTSVEIRNANCGENNGSVNILTFSNNIALFTLRWIDSVSNQLIGVNPSISGLGEGTFLLLATDTNGCGKKIYTAHISSLQKPAINYSGMVINNDECSLNNGSITGIAVSGLVGPTSYSWENFYNQQQGNTLNLSDKEAGQYRLTITDGGNCVVRSGWLNINNTDIQLSQPQYDNQTILRNTSATLAIKNFTTGTYSLYSDPFATQLIQENNSGEFVTGNITRDTLFYIKNKSGSCESSPVPVKITVVDKVVVYVPSAFTPNHDGKNDVLKVIAYGPITLESFRIYNRWGGLVFSTNSFNSGWDGKYKSTPLDTGVFVWILKAKDNLSGASIQQRGTVTLIR